MVCPDGNTRLLHVRTCIQEGPFSLMLLCWGGGGGGGGEEIVPAGLHLENFLGGANLKHLKLWGGGG